MKTNKILGGFLLLGSLLFTGFTNVTTYRPTSINEYNGSFQETVIAHAGGYANGTTEDYLNCYECVIDNYNLGTRFFEIDFRFSTDGKLIATHNYENTDDQKMTFNDFKNYRIDVEDSTKTFTTLTVERLVYIMKTKPSAYFFIDTKDDNKTPIIDKLVLELNDYTTDLEYASIIKRIVPYVFSEEDYYYYKARGYAFQQYAFTRYNNVLFNVFNFASERQYILNFMDEKTDINIFVAAEPGSFTQNKAITKEFIEDLMELNYKVYLYNSSGDKPLDNVTLSEFEGLGVTGIISDGFTVKDMKNIYGYVEGGSGGTCSGTLCPSKDITYALC